MNPVKHVAIIMEGNGRWGIKKKKSRKQSTDIDSIHELYINTSKFPVQS